MSEEALVNAETRASVPSDPAPGGSAPRDPAPGNSAPRDPAPGVPGARSSATAHAESDNWVAANGSGELADAMGIEFTEFTIERTVGRMPVVGNRQTVGFMHGGAYVVLGESLGSMAANLHAGPGRLAVGVDINATHTRSATQGYVTGVCTPVHLGRTLTVHEIVVTDEAGKRCCTMRITNVIKDMPADAS